MPLDPISYSLIKKKDYITGTSIIYSSIEPEDKTVIWFDTGVRKPKIYDNQSGKWGVLGYTIGYSDFDNNLDRSWSYYINIPITISPSESVQYKIEINGDNINVYSNDGTTVLTTGTGGLDFWNKVQTDGKDIRVFDEIYSQNYFWVETFNYTSRKMVIWVKIDAGQEQVNIAYGNDDCLVSNYHNGSMTFEFFDDFEGSTLDPNKWKRYVPQDNYTGGLYEVNNSNLHLYGSGSSINGNIIIESVNNNFNMFRACILGNIASTSSSIYIGTMDFNNNYRWIGTSWNRDVICYHDTSGVTALTESKSNITNKYVKYFIKYDGNTLIYNVSNTTITKSVTGGLNIQFMCDWPSYSHLYIDYIYIWKYITTDLSFNNPTIKEF